MNGSFHSVAEKRLSGVEGFVDLANYSVKIVQLLLANYPLFFYLFPSLSFYLSVRLQILIDRF